MDYTRLLTSEYQSNPLWAGLFRVVSTLFDAEIHSPAEALRSIRNADAERIFLIRTAQMLGINFDSDSLDDASYRRLVEFISIYNSYKGSGNFADFMGFFLDARIDVRQLWTQFHNEETYNDLKYSPQGLTLAEGGVWYPTSHVGLLYDIERDPGVPDTDLETLFYELAPINLVLDHISGAYYPATELLYLSTISQSTAKTIHPAIEQFRAIMSLGVLPSAVTLRDSYAPRLSTPSNIDAYGLVQTDGIPTELPYPASYYSRWHSDAALITRHTDALPEGARFRRVDTAWYRNDAGEWILAAENEPRFDYVGGRRMLRMEPYVFDWLAFDPSLNDFYTNINWLPREQPLSLLYEGSALRLTLRGENIDIEPDTPFEFTLEITDPPIGIAYSNDVENAAIYEGPASSFLRDQIWRNPERLDFSRRAYMRDEGAVLLYIHKDYGRRNYREEHAVSIGSSDSDALTVYRDSNQLLYRLGAESGFIAPWPETVRDMRIIVNIENGGATIYGNENAVQILNFDVNAANRIVIGNNRSGTASINGLFALIAVHDTPLTSLEASIFTSAGLSA